MTDVDLDIYEDDSIEDAIVRELEGVDGGMTSRQLAHNILGKGYSGHRIQKALERVERDGRIERNGRRWEVAQ